MTLKEYKAELTDIFRCNTTRGFADWRQCGSLAYDAFMNQGIMTITLEYTIRHSHRNGR